MRFGTYIVSLQFITLTSMTSFGTQAISVLGHEQFSAAIPQRAPVRWKHSTPFNTVVMFVPQQEAWVVERMGRYDDDTVGQFQSVFN